MPICLPNWCAAPWPQSSEIFHTPSVAPDETAIGCCRRMVCTWEMAMSELKQQTIALWILLMLLILVVPLALE